jgi:hypothetical protein
MLGCDAIPVGRYPRRGCCIRMCSSRGMSLFRVAFLFEAAILGLVSSCHSPGMVPDVLGALCFGVYKM